MLARLTSLLPIFAPNSAGPPETIARLTVVSAQQTIPLLLHLAEGVRHGCLRHPIPRADSLCQDESSHALAVQLKQKFDEHGSDKASAHDYHFVYAHILSQKASVRAVLEVGIGTHYEDVASTMGSGATPGASLRAFRDVLPDAEIYGADIDSRILFREDRIQTFAVDQTDLDAMNRLGHRIGASLDLLIDDGLHAPNANLSVLLFGTAVLRAGAWLVIEDINPAAVPVWHLVSWMLGDEYAAQLVEARGGFVFLMQKQRETNRHAMHDRAASIEE